MDRFSIISRHTAGSALEVSPSLVSQKAARPFSLPAQQADPTHLNSAYPSNVPQARQHTSERSRGNEGSRAVQGDAARPMPGETITHALAQVFPASFVLTCDNTAHSPGPNHAVAQRSLPHVAGDSCRDGVTVSTSTHPPSVAPTVAAADGIGGAEAVRPNKQDFKDSGDKRDKGDRYSMLLILVSAALQGVGCHCRGCVALSKGLPYERMSRLTDMLPTPLSLANKWSQVGTRAGATTGKPGMVSLKSRCRSIAKRAKRSAWYLCRRGGACACHVRAVKSWYV